MKVLITKVDADLFGEVSYCLQVAYPGVSIVPNVDAFLLPDAVEVESPDLVILDWDESRAATLDIIRRTRAFCEVPLVVLSKAISDVDIARCLDTGADECILKPLSAMQFLARIGVVLRRTRGSGRRVERTVSFGPDLSINFDSYEVLRSGNPVKLTPIEYRLLSELVRNEGRVLSHQTILVKVWGADYAADEAFVKKYIYRLRNKLERHANSPEMFLCERGVGYRFVRPSTALAFSSLDR